MSNIVYNPDAVAVFTIQFEQYRQLPYLDEAGVPTIGIGTTKYMITFKRVTMQDPPMPYTQAVQELAWDYRNIIAVLNKVITVQLNEHQTTSISSLCYNIGEDNFANSTLCRVINENGTEHELHQGFMMWNKITDKDTGQLVISNGLVNRRQLEFNLFIS